MRRIFILTIISWSWVLSSCADPQGGPTVIRIGYLQNDLHHLPAFVALDQGLFTAEGLEARIGGIFRAGPEEMSAFGAGELDAGYVGQAPATAAFLNNVSDVTFIAQVNLEGSALVVSPTLAGLQGASIAIPGHATMQDLLLRRALEKEGLTIAAIKPIVLKPPEMIQALELGNIDGFIAWEPYPVQAQRRGAGRIRLRSGQVWENHPCCVLVVATAMCRQQPETVKKILSAHQKACDFIANNRAQAIAVGMKYTGMDQETVAQAIGHIKYTPVLDQAKAMEFVDFLKQLRYIKPRGRQRQPAEMFGKP
jgi:NitT/TauT family transport system substrate-binding protein